LQLGQVLATPPDQHAEVVAEDIEGNRRRRVGFIVKTTSGRRGDYLRLEAHDAQ